MITLVSAAHAFCGTFVGEPGQSLVNEASQVVLARYNDVTTLTVTADYTGEASEFGLLLPVPEVLTAEDVRTMDPELIERIATFSEPRRVAYTCEDVQDEGHSAGGLGCSGGDESKDSGSTDFSADTDSTTVTVETSFEVDGYEIVVLSAEESAGLMTWLDSNGYAVPDGGEAILQEYIDGGSYFLAAKVTVDLTGETTELLPLQFTYSSEIYSLPIRIGTISADGAQEVIVYALAYSLVGVSNYDEARVEDECMWGDEDDDFAAFYESQLDAAYDGEAGWVSEYAWSLTANCDPCTSVDGLTPEELYALGLPSYHGYISRLRLRYTPEQAVEDVMLYESGSTGDSSGYTGYYGQSGEQIRYIDYVAELESTFEVCGEGWVDNPGTCATGEPVVECAAPGGQVGGVGVFLALAAMRRRR